MHPNPCCCPTDATQTMLGATQRCTVMANSSAGLHSLVLSSAQRATIKVSWELSPTRSCSNDEFFEEGTANNHLLSKIHKKYSSWETRTDGRLLSGLPVPALGVHPLSPIGKEQEELAGERSARVCQQLQGATYSPCCGEEDYFPLHRKQSRHLQLSQERLRCANSAPRALKQSTALQTAPSTALLALLSRAWAGFGALRSQHQLPLGLPALLVGHVCMTSHPLTSTPPPCYT